MASLPIVKAREVIQALLKAGFYIHHQKGSHARLFHNQRPDLKVTVPIHNKDLGEKVLRRIIEQAGLTDEEFIKLLK